MATGVLMVLAPLQSVRFSVFFRGEIHERPCVEGLENGSAHACTCDRGAVHKGEPRHTEGETKIYPTSLMCVPASCCCTFGDRDASLIFDFEASPRSMAQQRSTTHAASLDFWY